LYLAHLLLTMTLFVMLCRENIFAILPLVTDSMTLSCVFWSLI
jgi:hypothetical protein